MATIAERVLAEAEAWIGTPYRHQGARKGVGCDCLGLVRGIWREIYGGEPEVFSPYAPDWAERSGDERLLSAAGRHFRSVEGMANALPGDLLIFRWQAGCAAKHAGILARAAGADGQRGETGAGGGIDAATGRPQTSGIPAIFAEQAAPPLLTVQPVFPAPPLVRSWQDTFIHAYEQSAVVRSVLVPAWRRRVAGVFRFPEV